MAVVAPTTAATSRGKRTCKKCGDSKKLGAFKLKKNGYRSHTCTKCASSRWWAGAKDRVNAYKRRRTQDFPAIAIMHDSRRFDKKRGFNNDLTRGFVEQQIALGCCYCGEDKLRMTLDRKDNSQGHTKENVVPACIRCNYARRDMPYEAWLHIAPSFREARERGLFGTWTGSARSARVVEQEDTRRPMVRGREA